MVEVIKKNYDDFEVIEKVFSINPKVKRKNSKGIFDLGNELSGTKQEEPLIDLSSLSVTETEIKVSSSSVDIKEEENNINQILRKFDELYTPILENLLTNQDLEYGMQSEAESFVITTQLNKHSHFTTWLNGVLLRNFSNKKIVLGLLNLISHLDYKDIKPNGIMMALSVLRIKDLEVVESGIRAFENWGQKDTVEILKSLHFNEQWLQEYLDQVISDIEE